MTLQERVEELISKHGGLRSAARAIKIDAGYLLRLRNGDKCNPSKTIMRRLGVRKVVIYEAIEKSQTKEPTCCGFCSYEESNGELIKQCKKCRAADKATREKK